MATACDGPGAGVDADRDEALRLEGSASSLDDLGERALSALVRADTAALDALRLTEREHNEIVWPELPASAPEVSFPVDFAWENIENRNRRGILRIVPIYEDRALAYDRTECRGATEQFETFRVRTDCWVLFATEGDSSLSETQLYKDILERAGGYKIFRFYDEEPRRALAGGGAAGGAGGVAP